MLTADLFHLVLFRKMAEKIACGWNIHENKIGRTSR